MIATAPTSSMIAMVTSSSLSCGGARAPSKARMPSAKAMSVAAGIAQPGASAGSNPVTVEEDQRGDDHPGAGGDDRQAPLVGGRQPPLIPFALHLQPDEQEEQRHRRIGDPLVDGQRAEREIPARDDRYRSSGELASSSAAAAPAISSRPASRSCIA